MTIYWNTINDIRHQLHGTEIVSSTRAGTGRHEDDIRPVWCCPVKREINSYHPDIQLNWHWIIIISDLYKSFIYRDLNKIATFLEDFCRDVWCKESCIFRLRFYCNVLIRCWLTIFIVRSGDGLSSVWRQAFNGTNDDAHECVNWDLFY